MILDSIDPGFNIGMTWQQLISLLVVVIGYGIALTKVSINFTAKFTSMQKDIQQGKDDHAYNYNLIDTHKIEVNSLIEKNRTETQNNLERVIIDNQNQHKQFFEKLDDFSKILYEIKGIVSENKK